jgi:hypothetical protein
MATNTLILRSRDRVDGESHHFRIQLAHPLQGCWALEYATIPNGHFTITAANNELRVATGGNEHTITVPVGYYSISVLVDALCTGLLPHDIVATYSSLTNRITFAAPQVFALSGASTIGPLVGVTTDRGFELSHTGDPVDLIGSTLCFHLVIDAPGCDYPVSDAAGRHATYWVPVSEDSLMHCEYKSGDYHTAQVAHFRTPCREITVRLVDAEHTTMELQGQEWFAVLRRL